MTVQLKSSLTTVFEIIYYEVYRTITLNKSGIPSPVIPEVGTIGIYSLGFKPSQYIAALNFC